MKSRRYFFTGVSLLFLGTTGWAGQFLIDFATLADPAPEPWTSFDELVEDVTVPLKDVTGEDNDVMLTVLDDGFVSNNPGAPNIAATYDGVLVPEEAHLFPPVWPSAN